MSTAEGSRPHATFAALAALLLCVGWLVAGTLAGVTYQPDSDDGFYLKYMREVATRGWAAFPEQFRWYLSTPSAHIFPPPSRLGFSLASAGWSKLFDASLPSLSKLSLASHLALVATQLIFARRHLGELRALSIAALTAFSPLLLGLARLPLTDCFISLCQVACMWIFFEVVSNPRSWAWRIAFVAAFTFAILSKEISGLLALPFAALLVVLRYQQRRELSIPLFAGLLALPPLIAFATWVAAAGSLEVVLDTLKIVLLSPATNEYALAYGGGPWVRYPVDQLLASAWPTLLGCAGLAVALWRWRQGDFDPLRIHFALIYVMQIGTLAFFTKNLRYLAALEAPLRALAVVCVFDFLASKRGTASRIAACAVIAALCVADWYGFRTLWIEKLVFDPVTQALGIARDLIPVAPAR